MQFGSTPSFSNSAAEPVAEGADNDPETVGWGSTTVGTLLRAKVRYLSTFSTVGTPPDADDEFNFLFFCRPVIPVHGSGAAKMTG